MPRAGLSPAVVVERAGVLVDEVGADRLTLAALAARLGVALPSLYKHVDSLADLRRRIAIEATAELGDRLTEAVAGRSGRAALEALAAAYRDYARERPGAYALTQIPPHAGDERHRAVAERATGVVFAALRGYGLGGDDAVDATRALRAMLHGFVLLEQNGGFGMPRRIDASFDQMVAAFDAALTAWPGE
ncbi:TetR-like C-terminal domain-containing protein [Naasia aerilata]|uniref:TetR family transcriptional regulator n=1 Tax=Naasia aerilata TaxID=1162966 RepID=A0ABM8G945_9MICO|nr:TetR-like C-terminal domain-containing protein [Naasia aerilata]BDZ44693.1 TetR family transcriptional regulator [Naasia aerilata]